MTVTLTVRDVRNHLLAQTGRGAAVGNGAKSTPLLGQFLHDVFAKLVTAGTPQYAGSALAEAEPDIGKWRDALIHHAYRQLVGPRLDDVAGQLQGYAEETAQFWDAIRELCEWIAGIFWEVYRAHGAINAADGLATCEVPLETEIREEGWTESVRLRGLADAVLRRNGSSDWCAIELKLGYTAPEADAAQAALYHLMLHGRNGEVPVNGTLALVSFKPRREERLFGTEELREATGRLKQLIGRMAGVIPETGAPAPARPSAITWGAPTAQHEELKQRLLRVLRTHQIDASIDEAPIVGPTFIRFLIKLPDGTRVSVFKGREQDIALGMHLEQPPQIERIRGRIAIDLARPDRQSVHYDAVRQFLPKADPLLGNSKLLVGVDLNGNVEFADLAEPEHCHILVAGTTGSGKSQWLRAAIASLSETNSPENLKLVLIDPKRNAFTGWRESPHLYDGMGIVFPDETSPVEVLQQLVDDMEARYRRMEEVENLRALIIRQGKPEPRIVCVCDEYFDLVEGNRKQRDEIEALLARLGSKARAAGIHLIIATQRPSRDVIRGALKSNLPARVGLTVSSAIEARIIDTPGAEHLLLHGDLLFKDIGEPRRLQGALLSEQDLARAAGQAFAAQPFA